MHVVRDAASIAWVLVPELAVEIGAIAYSRPFPHRDSISIVDASWIAQRLGVQLLPARVAQRLFTQYPQKGEVVYAKLAHQGNVHTWLTGTLIVAGQISRTGVSRTVEDAVTLLDDVQNDEAGVGLPKKVFFSITNRLRSNVGIVEFPHYNFQKNPDGLRCVVERQDDTMQQARRDKLDRIECLRSLNELNRYMGDSKRFGNDAHAKLFGVVAPMHGPFGASYSTFVRLSANGALAYRELQR